MNIFKLEETIGSRRIKKIDGSCPNYKWENKKALKISEDVIKIEINNQIFIKCEIFMQSGLEQ